MNTDPEQDRAKFDLDAPVSLTGWLAFLAEPMDVQAYLLATTKKAEPECVDG